MYSGTSNTLPATSVLSLSEVKKFIWESEHLEPGKVSFVNSIILYHQGLHCELCMPRTLIPVGSIRQWLKSQHWF